MRLKQPLITWKSSGKANSLRILGVNPWIYDFAAYNVWSRPAGLLTCLDMFARSGCDTALIDLMDQDLSDLKWTDHKKTGKGPYPKVALPKPFVLKDVPRQFSRYGLPRQRAVEAFSELDPKPDLILVTSLMTYWYAGIISVIGMIREIMPGVKVCLGGIYATLCTDHARGLDADMVVSGPLERPDNWLRVWELMGKKSPPLPEHAGMIPDISYYQEPDFSILMCSRGCPFKCPYCASSMLYPGFRQSDPDIVIAHIKAEYERGTRDFCFYDDALLVNPENLLYPVLNFIIEHNYNLRLHAPNALHIKYLTPRICTLLKQAGLSTIRLGLETTDFKNRRDAKLLFEEWRDGIFNLLQAGFVRRDIVVYVLTGLPGQTEEEVEATLRECLKMGIRPELNYYSPIPGTPLFKKAVEVSGYALDEPLFQNNSIWPCVQGGFSWETQKCWKKKIRNPQ